MKWFVCIGAALTLLAGGAAHAGVIDTVDWAPNSSGNGMGTGTLSGGTITVNYTSIAGGNSGNTITDNWATSLATAAAVPGGVTNQTAGIFATSTASSPATETITFSAAVIDPILMVNYTDAGGNYNFGSLSLTLLSSNNAQLSGDTVTFNGSGGDVNSGFAVQINGTFGPGNALTFQDTISSSETVNPDAFTIGLASPVPEPTALTLFGIGTVGLLGFRRISRKRAAV